MHDERMTNDYIQVEQTMLGSGVSQLTEVGCVLFSKIGIAQCSLKLYLMNLYSNRRNDGSSWAYSSLVVVSCSTKDCHSRCDS
jgi:hypothetical protein